MHCGPLRQHIRVVLASSPDQTVVYAGDSPTPWTYSDGEPLRSLDEHSGSFRYNVEAVMLLLLPVVPS